MARTSRSDNGAVLAPTGGTTPGAAPSDIDAAGKMMASTLHQEHRLLQWLAQAQRLQAEALKAWDGAVNTAADSAERATAWDELFAVQRDLVSEGMARLAHSETAFLSSWFDLQTEFAQQAQDRATEIARRMWNGAAQAESLPSSKPLEPSALLSQSQAALQSMWRPWGALFSGSQQG